jgi:hypothetical protein
MHGRKKGFETKFCYSRIPYLSHGLRVLCSGSLRRICKRELCQLLDLWLGLVFPTTGGNVWYFEVTPVPEVFFVAGVACLAMVLAIPPVLFKLRSLVVHGAPKPDLIRWSCIVAVAYLFVVF